AVLEVCNDPELDLRAPAVSQAYARGDLCVGAFQKEALVGYCWLAFSPLPHLDGVWVRFAPTTAWLYKSFVRTSHRGRGIAPALYAHGDQACAERGRRHSVICVESHNQPSVRAALGAAYRASGYGGYVLRAMPLSTWCTPAAKRHGIAFFLPRLA
ncbi:MAG TPA: GNAT family N-acetyltransferase, partial [Burkholderiales bacterium]